MNIHRLQLLSGAMRAQGLAVIIDVFRAFSVACYCFERGVERIYPVSDIEDALLLKENFPDAMSIGERAGYKLEGFDFGNSPSEIMRAPMLSSVIIHTTSAGTQGLIAAEQADSIVTGSFVNAGSIARYIRHNSYHDVSLVAMGTSGHSPADEDNLCASYVESLINDEPVDEEKIIQRLYYGAGRKFFQRQQRGRFPSSDFHWCTLFNRFDFIISAELDETGIRCLVRQDID